MRQELAAVLRWHGDVFCGACIDGEDVYNILALRKGEKKARGGLEREHAQFGNDV